MITNSAYSFGYYVIIKSNQHFLVLKVFVGCDCYVMAAWAYMVIPVLFTVSNFNVTFAMHADENINWEKFS